MQLSGAGAIVIVVHRIAMITNTIRAQHHPPLQSVCEALLELLLLLLLLLLVAASGTCASLVIIKINSLLLRPTRWSLVQ